MCVRVCVSVVSLTSDTHKKEGGKNRKKKKRKKRRRATSPRIVPTDSIKLTATSYIQHPHFSKLRRPDAGLVLVWWFKRAVLIRRLQRPSLILSRVPRSCNSLKVRRVVRTVLWSSREERGESSF